MTQPPPEPGKDLEPTADSGGPFEAGDEVIEAELIDDEPSDDHPSAEPVADGVAPSSERLPKRVITVLWVAGVAVAVLLLAALFLIGTRIPGYNQPMPIPTPTATASPSPAPTALPPGPLEPGTHRWDALLGGECLAPYDGAWQDEYTVVNCVDPHPAQLVLRGTFADPVGTQYPGFEQLASRMNLLCTAPSVVDYAAAAAFGDIQVQASFALDAEDWDDGNRTYFCFLSRSSGEPFTVSIAVPQAAPSP